MMPPNGKECQICGTGEAVARCERCGRDLCRKCRVLDLRSFGCGSTVTLAFCAECHSAPDIDEYRG